MINRMTGWICTLTMMAAGPSAYSVSAAETLRGSKVINSLGMEMIQVEPGSFMMGSEEVYKEHPVHKVHISKPFRMSATQVTNEQYEQFDPEHRKLRGKFGLSKDDDEAVIFVSWHDAVAFCEWLSEKEGIPYRLPTEAEWEYAARAGTTTRYNTGDTLPDEFHRNQRGITGAETVALHVGQTTPNAWGLHDMHGLVEEWVSDWYGPYTAEEKTDPVGRADGAVKVTRGGSHGTTVEYLRSATRLGTLPEDKSWLIGFRVVQAEPLDTKPLPPEPLPRWAKDVCQEPWEWERIEEPYFRGPIPFVNIPVGSLGPLYCCFTITYGHVNHVPAVTWCANGDLIAAWFSCSTGTGGDRMMTTGGSRLRAGSEEWTEADVFFNAPGRNQTGTSLFQDGDGVLYWYNGLSAARGILHNNALVMSTSNNHGVTWSRPTLVYADRLNPINAVTIMDNITLDVTIPSMGRHVLYTDNNNARMRGGSTALMFINTENGDVTFSEGNIAGIHATAVKLKDGLMLAVGRTLIARDTGEGIEGLDKSKLPMSISRDGGNTWEYRDSEFPGISGGQRCVLMRLQEGPLLLVSFTGPGSGLPGMLFEDRTGQTFRGHGMFAALSFDEGQTWPQRKLITPADGQTYNGEGNVRNFRATHTQAEPRGYLTATQTPDGVVHLLSSGLHYRFNLAWLKQPAEPVPPPPLPDDIQKPTASRPVLWDGGKLPASSDIPLLPGVRFHVIKPYEYLQDGYRWLHGTALAWHGNRLYASFGHNRTGENMAGEEARGRFSSDGGRTWSEVFTIATGHVTPELDGKSFYDLRKLDEQGVNPGENVGISHGVLLSHDGNLWSFNGAFGHTIHYNHHVRAYKLDEQDQKWTYMGRMLDNFWPMQAPRQMEDGNWIMAGVHTPTNGREAAVAISHGDNLLEWDLVVIPKVDAAMWGESGVLLNGSRVISIARSGPSVASALVAVSDDYGRTWTPSEPSNLPMASVKPSVGTLSTGQHYLISTTTADSGNRRAPLTIAVTRPGEEVFTKIWIIRHAVFPEGPGESHPGANLSYPDAVEHDGYLYVSYSNSGDLVIRVGEGRERANNNSAELAIIPITSLHVD